MAMVVWVRMVELAVQQCRGPAQRSDGAGEPGLVLRPAEEKAQEAKERIDSSAAPPRTAHKYAFQRTCPHSRPPTQHQNWVYNCGEWRVLRLTSRIQC
jgi:hypothetical protein